MLEKTMIPFNVMSTNTAWGPFDFVYDKIVPAVKNADPLIFAGLAGAVTAVSALDQANKLYQHRKHASEMVYFKVHPSFDLEVKNVEQMKRFLIAVAELRLPHYMTFWKTQHWFRFIIRCGPPEGKASLYFGVPKSRLDGFKDLFRSAYTGVEICELTEGNLLPTACIDDDGTAVFKELELKNSNTAYPMKMYGPGTMSDTDPLNAIIHAMGAGVIGQDEEVILDVIFRPGNDFQLYKKATEMEKKMRSGDTNEFGITLEGIAAEIQSNGKGSTKKNSQSLKQLTDFERKQLQAIREKGSPMERAFDVGIRIYSSGYRSKARIHAMIGGFQYMRGQNALQVKRFGVTKMLENSIKRGTPYNSITMSTAELVGLLHIPDSKQSCFKHIDSSPAKTIRAPRDMATSGIYVGQSNYPGDERKIYLTLKQVLEHVFIAGRTGAGKTSVILEIFKSVLALIQGNQANSPGFSFIDPHGDAIRLILALIPDNLMHKVHYVPLGRTNYPRGFNFFEVNSVEDAEEKTSEFVASLRALFPGQTGPRMDHHLRNGLLTLLQVPPQTILGIPVIFSEEKFRARILSQVKDPQLRRYWTNEFSKVGNVADVIGPIWNKIGALTTYRSMRQMLGQPRSTINIRKIMDDGDIVLIDGAGCGPDEFKLTAGLYTLQYHFAAKSRGDTARGYIPESKRRPHLLIKDEAHLSLIPVDEKILSEDRKYGLSSILATQYMEQIPESILYGILNNIGTKIMLKLGPTNADRLAKWLQPDLTSKDLQETPKLNGIVNTSTPDGRTVLFTTKYNYTEEGDPERVNKVLEYSDQHDGRPAEEVEEEILSMYGSFEDENNRLNTRMPIM